MISVSALFLLLEKFPNTAASFSWRKLLHADGFKIGFCYGFGYFLAGIYWIASSLTVDLENFGWLIPFALTFIPGILALYFAFFSHFYQYLIHNFGLVRNYEKIFLFSVLWLIFEVLRANLFTGFPWNLLGYIWMFDDGFAQLAAIFGIYGLTLFAVFVCLLPTIPLLTCKHPKIAFLKLPEYSLTFIDKLLFMAMISLFICSGIFGYARIINKNFIDGTESKARLVQANIEQKMKWSSDQKYFNFLRHVELSNSQPLDEVKAVIWSESSLPYLLRDDPELLYEMRKSVPENGVLISGAVRAKGDIDEIKFWNSIFVLSKNSIEGVYDKHHLVPFGEYVPLQRFLPFIKKITQGSVGFSEGDGASVLRVPGDDGFEFSPLLCYEVIFSGEVLPEYSSPDFFINLTNDSWFGETSGPYQHLNIARMRAIEYGIPLIRVAQTGITALIDPYGRIIAKIGLNEEGIIDVPLIKKLQSTFYKEYGNSAVFLMSLSLLCCIFIRVFFRKN